VEMVVVLLGCRELPLQQKLHKADQLM